MSRHEYYDQKARIKRSVEVDFEELLAERVQRIRLTVVIAGGDAAGQAAEGGGQASAEGGGQKAAEGGRQAAKGGGQEAAEG